MKRGLFISGLTNTIYICGIDKKGKPTSDRTPVEEGEFIFTILEWAKGKDENKTGIIDLTKNGEVIATINLIPQEAKDE